jgi:hypothetical protein
MLLMEWKYIGVTSNDSFVINGADIFQEDWVNAGITVKVKDPNYGEIHTLTVWSITVGGNEITFAAGEFSNNVWGIYAKD